MRAFKTKSTGRPKSLSPETEHLICEEARTDPLFSYAESARRHNTTDGTVRATLRRHNIPLPPKRYSLYEFPTTRFWKTRSTARKRGLEFNLTMDYLDDLFRTQERKCPYTGWTLTFATTCRSYDGTASLDRIDSSKGYVKGNVQWVHKHVNLMKLALSHEDFITICRTIAANCDTGSPVDPLAMERVRAMPSVNTVKWRNQPKASS